MTTIIEAYLPFGNFSVIEDGKRVKNLIEFKFEAEALGLSYLTLKFGDIERPDNTDVSKTVMAHLANQLQHIKIEINGPMGSDVTVYIDGVCEKTLQKLNLECDKYGENNLTIQKVLC
ncbi:gp433 [Bacillus phage G]|uniref:Gp433 n=1 Tax=Bacillus phage G TaxID=2884420 RepID=G3MAH4_9CAUD|nr:gp433 [Bacillus phage G]AEO93691.1 gp433 [Bacillus phage G]